jgi:outer membrane protein assembly factor BamB
VKWKHSAPAAVHSAPVVMNGLVYFASCSSCGQAAGRAVKRGPDGTYALRARSGRVVWRYPSGKVASPVVADEKRVFITGQSRVYGLVRKKRGGRG